MKDLLQYILENILEDNGVKVEEEDTNGFVTLKIHSSQKHMGKIIGKGGKTVNSIKNLLKIMAIKEGKKVDVQVVEQQ